MRSALQLLLLLLLLLGLHTCLSHGNKIEHIQQCGSYCSQGLHCRTRPYLTFTPCKNLPEGLQNDVSLNMSVYTVMRCTGRQQCSLFLQVSGSLAMNEHVKGVSICTVAAGTMERCRTHVFHKAAQKQLSGQQVEVQDNCFEVAVGQDVHVTLKTVPEFCHLRVSKTYSVPGCSHADLQKNVPECIAGKITYQLNSERKALSISVTDMLENTDYNLRLCHKGYICRGTGAQALLKKEYPQKNATLTYTRPLPCLCIEGWSSVFDAPRVQVCPFKNNMEELWSGVAFDSVKQTLSWEPACQTEVAVTLCQNTEESGCQNLANSTQSVSRGKVSFSTVDPHPRLCMKFSTKMGSWIKCPFAGSDFTAWDIEAAMVDGKTQLVVTSKIRPTLLLSSCRRAGPLACEGNEDILTFNVVKHQSVVPNLTLAMCGENCCIQARRIDVKYAAKVLLCDFNSSGTGGATAPVVSTSHWQTVWIVAPAIGLLTALLVSILTIGTAVTVITAHQRKCGGAVCHVTGSQHNAGSANPCSPQHTQPSIQCYYPAIEDTPNFENSEKTNLLNWVKKDSTI
ncbi:hypothetical protein ACEWY4_001436 [Coilia grayii]|uniref:Interleukin-17 receptor C/E N-terminal domain-containing protein n=1 Tax=Coilia grayii TaxID=363190 RepID=A0ABD1KSX1_9TELE